MSSELAAMIPAALTPPLRLKYSRNLDLLVVSGNASGPMKVALLISVGGGGLLFAAIFVFAAV